MAVFSRNIFHRATAVCFAAVALFVVVSQPPKAHALTGREAVGACIDSTASGARCGWSVDPNDGSIDVCNKSGCITCASAESECKAARSLPTKPPTGFPPGTTVTTSLGTFTTTAKPYLGPLLKAPSSPHPTADK